MNMTETSNKKRPAAMKNCRQRAVMASKIKPSKFSTCISYHRFEGFFAQWDSRLGNLVDRFRLYPGDEVPHGAEAVLVDGRTVYIRRISQSSFATYREKGWLRGTYRRPILTMRGFFES